MGVDVDVDGVGKLKGMALNFAREDVLGFYL